MTRDEILTLCAGDGELARRILELLVQRDSQHRAESDRMFALFDEAPVYLTVQEGPELRIAMINRMVRESPVGGTLLGKTVRELYPADNPILAALERVYATGVPETMHESPPLPAHTTHAGRYFTRSFVPLRDGRGDVRAVLSLTYEVTEQVRARRAQEESQGRSQAELQRLFALLDEAPILLNVLEGPELRIVMANRRTREMFAGRDLIGRSFRDDVPPSNATLAAAVRVYASGVSETFEATSRDVEGFVGRSFTQTVVPIGDPDGKITRVMVASVETTEQRRAQEALEAQARDLESARRQAVEASRAKDEFLAMLGHELRNPLAPMVMTLELMRLTGRTSPEVELLERQVRHMTRLVDDLLDVSRIARGRVELQRQNVALSTIVNRALEMTRPLIEERRHRIFTELAPAAVHADPDRLAQVVANLITNAAKYSEIGAPIRILTQHSGARVRLAVVDHGIGIAPGMIGRVFEAFVQQPQMLARSQGGLGLGLSIVKSLVEAHGGTVSAHSDGPGRGSTFAIELPASEDPRDGAGATQPDTGLKPSVASRRILVVDDNRDAALALESGFGALGHEVVVAHDGPSALAAAETFKPELGFLDIGLPGMDGYELAAALRAAHDIRLVAITGYGQDRDRQRSREVGFEDHLVKPIGLEQISLLLQRLDES